MKILFYLVMLFLPIAKAEITVIANNDLSVAAADVKDIFTGDKATVSGVKLNLFDNKAAMKEFCQKVVKIECSKYSANWAKKSFREGLPFPKEKNSDSEVIEAVKSTAGGMGYLSGTPPEGVKVVAKF